MIPALTVEQQEEFEQLIDSLAPDLKNEFTLERSEFLRNPLQRYHQTYFYPIDKSLSRAQMRKAVEAALYINKLTAVHTVDGKGVYMRDTYRVGSFNVEIACARVGGRLICFTLNGG